MEIENKLHQLYYKENSLNAKDKITTDEYIEDISIKKQKLMNFLNY